MRTLTCIFVLAAVAVPTADAQRPFRFGPTYHSIAVDDGTGDTHRYLGYGASVAYLSADDGEMGVTISRYDDLSNNACVRQLTFYGLDSFFYPIGAGGIAPFATAQVGLARVTEAEAPLLFSCTSTTPVTTTSELGIGYGLGVRVGSKDFAGVVEGRFFQVPNSFIQGLELRANASVALGHPRATDLLRSTLGPTVSWWVPLDGALRARGPLVGVRFRRDTKSAGSIGLQVDYAPLEITDNCTTFCEPGAILFQPGYEASLHPRWGRAFGELGFVLAGFPGQGQDRGMAQGVHGGLGADIYSGALMWNLQSRVLWLQRSSGENVFAVLLGVSLSPKLVHPKAAAGSY